jgi:hypothetical protein
MIRWESSKSIFHKWQSRSATGGCEPDGLSSWVLARESPHRTRVARGLGQGVQVGSDYWVVFGLSATAGPILTGLLADRAGFGAALRLTFLLDAAAVAVPALGLDQAWLIVSTVVVGAIGATSSSNWGYPSPIRCDESSHTACSRDRRVMCALVVSTTGKAAANQHGLMLLLASLLLAC